LLDLHSNFNCNINPYGHVYLDANGNEDSYGNRDCDADVYSDTYTGRDGDRDGHGGRHLHPGRDSGGTL
jgi:hypothetical protein